jgi:hypothetical protein
MQYYEVESEPMQINRINGCYITGMNTQYRFGIIGYICMVREFMIESWTNETLDGLICDKLNEPLILVRSKIYFEKLEDYEMVSWYIMDNTLHICIYILYPGYFSYYTTLILFGHKIDAKMCDMWCELTKDIKYEDKEEMETLLLALLV